MINMSPRILWNPKIHYLIHKCPPFLCLSQGQYFFSKDTTLPSLGVEEFLRLYWQVCVLLIAFNIDIHSLFFLFSVSFMFVVNCLSY